jgi:hypothetical protein
MEQVVHGRFSAGLVGDVACVAAHIQRGVPAALRGHIQPSLVTAEAEVFFLPAGCWLEELILVVGGVRVVASEAIADRWGMDSALDVGRLFVCVASDAKRRGSGGDQLHTSDVFVDPDLMAGSAAHGHGGMNRFAFGFVFVALEAFSRVSILVQRNGMNRSKSADSRQYQQSDANP